MLGLHLGCHPLQRSVVRTGRQSRGQVRCRSKERFPAQLARALAGGSIYVLLDIGVRAAGTVHVRKLRVEGFEMILEAWTVP